MIDGNSLTLNQTVHLLIQNSSDNEHGNGSESKTTPVATC